MQEFQPTKIYIEHRLKKKTVLIRCVPASCLGEILSSVTKAQKKWIVGNGFKANAGQVALVPGEEGQLHEVLFGVGDASEENCAHLVGGLPAKLPDGAYEFEGSLAADFELAVLWGLGAYQFNAYKTEAVERSVLLKLGKKIDTQALYNRVGSVYFGRDLINTPANDLGPDYYETVIKKFATGFKAKCRVVKGEALLPQNFPMIHAVGRASTQEPRLIELNWGKKSDPKVTLVGKGICFDTGGLNLKPGNSMNLMKKDMGGSATALTIASMVMGAKLPICLRVLLPIAENNISGNAFRPGDVLSSRKGLRVEIGNTDAEGRLVLADALALADEQPVDLLLCFATLTGAARVALGPDLPPFYSDDDVLADELEACGKACGDMMWRLPFWERYNQWLSSKIADVNHISNGGFAGSITAALFLRRFVERANVFAHFDIYGWTPETLPGKPYGGEPQTARSVFDYLKKTYG